MAYKTYKPIDVTYTYQCMLFRFNKDNIKCFMFSLIFFFLYCWLKQFCDCVSILAKWIQRVVHVYQSKYDSALETCCSVPLSCFNRIVDWVSSFIFLLIIIVGLGIWTEREDCVSISRCLNRRQWRILISSPSSRQTATWLWRALRCRHRYVCRQISAVCLANQQIWSVAPQNHSTLYYYNAIMRTRHYFML